MTTADGHAETTNVSEAPTRKTFRNWRLGALWTLAGIVALAAFGVMYRRTFGLLLAPVSLFCFYAAVVQALGVVVRESDILVTAPLLRWLPIVPKARTRVELASLKDLTALGSGFGQEIVGLTVSVSQIPVLFPTRAARLAFFETMGKLGVRIYRTYG